MKLILYLAIALSIFSSLGFAAPFENNGTIALLVNSNNACYIYEYDISGTLIESTPLPNGYSCDASRGIAQLDVSGSILTVPLLENTDNKIITLNPNKEVVDTTTVTGVIVTGAIVSGTDMWLTTGYVSYTTRGSSGAPTTLNIGPLFWGGNPLTARGTIQLLGTKLLFINALTELLQIDPVVKTGTGTTSSIKDGTGNFVYIERFYLHKSTNLYTHNAVKLSKYSFQNSIATIQYSISLSAKVIAMTAIEVAGTTYVFLTYTADTTSILVRYTDTGSAFTGATNIIETTDFSIRSVSPSPLATCSDGFKDQDETDIDCGGDICTARCADTKSCSVAADCTSNYCNPNNKCSTPACDDGFMNQDETDIDCGGDTCSANCDTGKICLANKDCKSNKCVESICMISCEDGVMNQDESDIDCGGNICSGCAIDQACLLNSDCLSGYCANSLCTTPTCDDSVQNQDETDADCGGETCSNRCDDGKGCGAGSDCSSGVCDSQTNKCSAPTCVDNVKNQDETDVDCGGAKCGKCADNKACKGASDCLSGVCDSGFCAVPSCEDSVMNGAETDVDCGGNTCTGCAIDKKCSVNSDCAGNKCLSNLCGTLPIVQACFSLVIEFSS